MPQLKFRIGHATRQIPSDLLHIFPPSSCHFTVNVNEFVLTWTSCRDLTARKGFLMNVTNFVDHLHGYIPFKVSIVEGGRVRVLLNQGTSSNQGAGVSTSTSVEVGVSIRK